MSETNSSRRRSGRPTGKCAGAKGHRYSSNMFRPARWNAAGVSCVRASFPAEFFPLGPLREIFLASFLTGFRPLRPKPRFSHAWGVIRSAKKESRKAHKT